MCMSKFDFYQLYFHYCVFDKGHLGWENIDKFTLENTFSPSSCLETQLSTFLKWGSKYYEINIEISLTI
jgi:hypothetical protein